MTNLTLGNLILGLSARIAEAVSSGAAWEIWLQTELLLQLRSQPSTQVAREVPYPAPHHLQRLDLLVRDTAGDYAIELKVESPTHAGAAILTAVQSDMVKLDHYPHPVPGARWAVGLAYSDAGRRALSAFATPAHNAIYAELNGIGVIIATR